MLDVGRTINVIIGGIREFGSPISRDAFSERNQTMTKTLRLVGILGLTLLLCAAAGWAAPSLTVTNAAALNGTNFGLQINFNNTAGNAYVQTDHPTDETHYLARFWLDPGTVAIDPNLSVRFGALGDDTEGQHIILFLKHDATTVPAQYQMNFWYKDKGLGGAYRFGGATYLSAVNAPCARQYEVEWTADTLAGATGNGTLVVRRNADTGACGSGGLITRTVSNMDNDTWGIDNGRFGTLNGGQSANGNSGFVKFDEFESYR